MHVCMQQCLPEAAAGSVAVYGGAAPCSAAPLAQLRASKAALGC